MLEAFRPLFRRWLPPDWMLLSRESIRPTPDVSLYLGLNLVSSTSRMRPQMTTPLLLEPASPSPIVLVLLHGVFPTQYVSHILLFIDVTDGVDL